MNIKLRAEDAVAQGVYSNSTMVNLTENEVTLDFIYLQPQGNVGHLRARVIVSPRHAKQLLRALGESVQRYEQRFGPIPEPRRAPKTVH